jgi:exopolyphosphatase/guanosine-5'-triphosphate,3'-diphosphate pyrophosphatase
MRVAALDLGTNSFLLLIQEQDSSGHIKTLHDESVIVRLGEGLQSSKNISEAALMRAKNCLEHFKKIIDQLKPDKLGAVTTAAARDAENANEFLEICYQNQIPVVILSGNEEARMSFQGALPDQAQGKYLLIDIGGGSTEYVVGTSDSISFSQSLSHGAVKLTEKFISKQPTPKNEIDALIKYIQTNSEETWAQVEACKPETLIAVAGTPTSLAAAKIGGFDAQKINGMLMTQTELNDWVQVFSSTSIQEKKDHYGLGARADVILAGTIILNESIKRLKLKNLMISTKGIRYGLADKLFNDFQS